MAGEKLTAAPDLSPPHPATPDGDWELGAASCPESALPRALISLCAPFLCSSWGLDQSDPDLPAFLTRSRRAGEFPMAAED